jgi:hypothetical protein
LTRKLLASLAIVAVAAVACTRGTGGASNATPNLVYVASPTEADVRSALGSQDWWATVPTFMVRPLNLPNTPENLKFAITNRFMHIGTSEVFIVDYVVYTTTSAASGRMTDLSNQLQTTTGPREGDQSLYYGVRSTGNTSLYSNVAIVRTGQTLIELDWERNSGFADFNQLGKFGGKLVTRLKDAFAGKVKPSPTPATDKDLLPPPGLDVTLVGSTRLPVESVAAALQTSSPVEVVDSLKHLGVKDFLYGDYALNNDLTMEVRASVLTFPTADDAKSWFTVVFGSSADSSGVLAGYSDAFGEYYAFFAAGAHVAMLFCSATEQFQAASRACEAPLSSLIGNWRSKLSG